MVTRANTRSATSQCPAWTSVPTASSALACASDPPMGTWSTLGSTPFWLPTHSVTTCDSDSEGASLLNAELTRLWSSSTYPRTYSGALGLASTTFPSMARDSRSASPCSALMSCANAASTIRSTRNWMPSRDTSSCVTASISASDASMSCHSRPRSDWTRRTTEDHAPPRSSM